MSTRTFIRYLLAIVIFSATLVFSQQATPQPKRPKIGLVFEGGGALGLAHVGVLQYFEEHRIPVSYVAGTSMGGLVGGIYATGYSAKQLTGLVHEIDWDDVLRGQIPFRDLAYRRKEDAIDYPNSLEFGIKHGVKFPSGFNSGYLVGLLLDRIALPYSGIKNFDELPTPFACVATDLVSSERLVLRDGSLAAALRSTMSLPGIFTPMRTKKAILVDGGLLDNLPVDVAQEMGAQLTIAIHLESRDLDATEPLSSVGVLGQSLSAVIAANENRSKKMADILISVPLTEFTSLDYQKDVAIIKKGYDAAAGKAAELAAYSVSEAEWSEYLAQRKARQRTVPTPKFVEVVGTTPNLAADIEHQLAAEVGKPVNTDELDRQLTLVVGDGRYSRLGFGMVDKNGQEGLQIQADEKQYGPPFIRPLLLINGSAYNNPQFDIGARITFLDVGGFGSEWRSDIALGYQYLAQTEYYHPLKKLSRWFVAPRLFAVSTQADYYRGNTFITDYSNRQSGGAFDAGYAIDRVSEFRVGYEIAEQKLVPTNGDSSLYGSLQGRVGATSVRYNHIGRDEPVVPRKGFDWQIKGQWFDANPGAPAGFPVAESQMTYFKPVSKPGSVYFAADGGTTFTYHQTGFPPFALGGNQNLLAYGTNEFLIDQYYLFKAGYIHRILTLPLIVGDKMYAIAGYEAAKVYGLPSTTSSVPTDGYAGILVNTFIGPILFGGAYGATGHHNVFFRLGRVF